MTRLQEFIKRWTVVSEQLKDLQIEYRDKPRGTAYMTRYVQLVNKLEFIKQQVLEYGTLGTIARVKGIRTRIGKKVKTVTVTEKFELYLVGVEDTDVHTIIKMKYPNVINYIVEIIKPGIILTK